MKQIKKLLTSIACVLCSSVMVAGNMEGAADDWIPVTINSEKVLTTCGHLAFGGCHVPSPAHSHDIMPKLVDAGFNNLRSDMWLETVLPKNITYEDYINNVNDVQNPDTWDYTNLEAAADAHRAGMKVMMIISYCPAWLTYNGDYRGIPKDMKVYADLVRKVYSRYHSYFDFIEIYNEPGYFLQIDKSPFATPGAALAEIYATCAQVVREITPDKPIGGTSVVMHSDGGVGGSTNRDFFADKRITSDNFNFYSHHVYGDYGIATERETVSRVRKELEKFGYGNLPIYFTEWSTSISNMGDSATYYGSKSHLFVGNCLVNWMREGLAGAQHWNYLLVPIDGAAELGISADHHGMYTWNARTRKTKLLPKAYVFKMMSKSLGLGVAQNQVVEIKKPTEAIVNMASFVNSKNEKCAVIVNARNVSMKLKLCFNGPIGITEKVEQYTVTYANTGEIPQNIEYVTTSNGVECYVNVTPNAVIGVKVCSK